MQIILTVMRLIVLQSLDGRELWINPEQVARLHEAREPGDPHKQLTDRAACVISMTDGRYVTVADPCNVVRQLLEAAK